jgi:hypothetical protein
MATSPCIRCGFIPDEKDKYCINCGAPLQNRCTNDGGLLGDPCTNINPPNAAFCAKCGAPTLFQKKGLIVSLYPHTHAEDDEWNSMDLFTRRFFTSP